MKEIAVARATAVLIMWVAMHRRVESLKVHHPLKREKSVFLTQRVHPFPFRTRKLSSAVVKILYGRLYGKIAQC